MIMKGYWQWLFFGARPGIYKFFDRWMLVHIPAALTLAIFLPRTLAESASALLFPMASVLVGLAFAWGGNAQALLQTPEVEDLASHHESGMLEEYAYTYQSAVLCILITLIAWAGAGLGFYELLLDGKRCAYLAISFILFFLASLTIRECWQVVLGSQKLLIIRHRIKSAKR